jgi:hypothetical protein
MHIPSIKRLHVLSLFAAITVASSASAALVAPYANAAAFQAALQPGSYLESFDGLTQGLLNQSLDFSSGAYSYTIGSEELMWSGVGNTGSRFLGNGFIDTTITVAFTGGNPTAIGADFFASDAYDVYLVGNVTLTLNDGTTHSFDSTETGGRFIGFITDSAHPITSLIIDDVTDAAWVNLDNLVVGRAVTNAVTNAVPEPSTYGLFGAVALLGLAAWRRQVARR